MDKEERNDLTFLFLLEVEGGCVTRIRLHPACIEDLGVHSAKEEERRFLEQTMQAKCGAFGTLMSVEGQVGTITIP